MATSDKIGGVHRDLALLSGFGSLSAIAGMFSYFMRREFKSNEKGGYFSDMFEKSRQSIDRVFAAFTLLFFVGILLFFLTTVLFVNEREEVAEDIPSMIHQARAQESQPPVNEPAIMSAIGSMMILMSAVQLAKEYENDGSFGQTSSLAYGAGWLLNSFALSMGNKSLDSISVTRLAWNIPGAVAISGGTLMIPWQIRRGYHSGPAWILITLGFTSLSIGSSLVTKPITV